MIFDSIENSETYYGLGEKFQKAFEFIKNTDFSEISDAKIEIDGDNIFALVQKYNTKNPKNAKWEAHRKYVDVQCMLSGAENIGFVLSDYLDITEEYNDENDVEFYDGLGDFVQLNEGEFAVFFPNDAHKPGLFIKESELVHKVVVKVRI
jgi:YhcH/YjgK/YiaL family protein